MKKKSIRQMVSIEISADLRKENKVFISFSVIPTPGLQKIINKYLKEQESISISNK